MRPFLSLSIQSFNWLSLSLTCSRRTMRILQFRKPGHDKIRVGVLSKCEKKVIDVSSFCQDSKAEQYGFGSVNLLASHPDLSAVKKFAEENTTERFDLSSVKIEAPVTKPDKVLCIGMNYADHCHEQNAPIPTEPVVFNKFPSTITRDRENIPFPENTSELDWEVELAVIVGKTAKNVSIENAMDHVAGYTVAHDVSARDWQLKRNGGQWLVGKTMDGFCPLGRFLVTKDEIPDINDLRIECLVNDISKQDSNTKQLVHKVDGLIVFLSNLFTLYPGDVILTGTPPGVGCFKKPPEFLKKGDTVMCRIEKIGEVTNKFV